MHQDPANTPTFWKAIATIVIWVMVVITVALTGVFLAPALGDESVAAIFLVVAAAIVSNGFIWNWGSTGQRKLQRKERESAEDELYELASNVGEKRKRDRLAVALSQLSDGELVNLRSRIRNGEIDEQELAEILSERES
jgi:hypothetical protein